MNTKNLTDRKKNVFTYLSGALGTGALAPAVGQAAVIAFTPSGVSTTTVNTNLSWDMTSSSTVLAPISGIYDLNLSDHGDLHLASGVSVVGGYNIANLAAGTMIGSPSSFGGSGYSYINGFGTSPGYIGVRFQIGGQTHYGWAKIQIAGGNHSVTAWAYEDQPGVAISAGAGAVPEAGSALLALAGLGGATLVRRRKQAA